MERADWAVVVPVKRLAVAKSRLAVLGERSRRELALAFAADVVAAALGCPVVACVLVVTDDADAADRLGRLGATVLADRPDAGLNPAIVHGAAAAPVAAAVAALSADLPALTSAALEAALRQVPPQGRGFVADADGRGTTLLAAARGVPLAPAFGPRSAAVHRRGGAVRLPGAPSLRRDVDTPEDLAAAVLLGVGPATAAALARATAGG